MCKFGTHNQRSASSSIRYKLKTNFFSKADAYKLNEILSQSWIVESVDSEIKVMRAKPSSFTSTKVSDLTAKVNQVGR